MKAWRIFLYSLPRFHLPAAAAFAWALLTCAAAVAGSSLPAPDKPAIVCSGAGTMRGLVRAWAAPFEKAHPGTRVAVDSATQLSADGVTALLAGRVNCVTFARELFPAEVAAYKAHFGREPRVIPVAFGSFATLHATHAIAIYVNAANPIRHFTLRQLALAFAAQTPDGREPAAPKWGALGLRGVWADRPIHAYGMLRYRASGNPPGIVNFLRLVTLHGREFRPDLRIQRDGGGHSALQKIVERVAADPDGIGFSGFGFARPGARAIAIARADDSPATGGTPKTVAADRYPLTRKIYLLFPPDAAGRVPANVRAFLKFVLGSQGQAIVARSREHFLPLTARLAASARTMAKSRASRPRGFAEVAGLPEYVPHAFLLPHGARYLRAGHIASIIGYNDMRGMLAAVDTLFMAAHPSVRFALDLRGTRTAPRALMRGTSALAPMGAPFEAAAMAAYRKATGGAPLQIRVAHAARDPHARSSPLAVYVNRANPLSVIQIRTLAAIFARPKDGVPITHWSQLGATGPWAGRAIHLYGLAPTTALGRFFRKRMFAGRTYTPGYSGYPESRDVIRHIARDPLGIGFADLNQYMPGVKLLALSACPACNPSRGSRADIRAGRYPLDRYLYIYVRRPLDPFAREYLRLVLSRQGQAAIAAVAPHYIPLSAQDLAAERAHLK